jgi:hypothetical protein
MISVFTGTSCPAGYAAASSCPTVIRCAFDGVPWIAAGYQEPTGNCPTGTTQHGTYGCADTPTSTWQREYCVPTGY